MAVPDTSIDLRLLESARKEFLQYGFERASLKTICDNAGIGIAKIQVGLRNALDQKLYVSSCNGINQ